jgi:spermidine synthase
MMKKRIIQEWLNETSGFFYTVNQSLYKGRTRYQEIELVETGEFGRVLLLDGITQVVEKNDWQYHEPMVHPALLSHPNPERVLVIGGGDGGVLREVLKYRTVKSVDFAELDEEVVAFSRAYLPGLNGGAFEDPRVEFHFQDGRAFVEAHPATFDVVIMDMTDPFGPSKLLYTREFYQAVKTSFRNEAGIFVMHSESPIARPVAFNCIRKTLSEVFHHVETLYTFIQMYGTLWSISLSSDSLKPTKIVPEMINTRIEELGLKDLHLITGESINGMAIEYPYLSEILKRPASIITDSAPDFPDTFMQEA